jgi:hypothetical protein
VLSKAIVFVFSFLGIVGLLLAFMPSEFLTAFWEPGYIEKEVTETFSIADIQMYDSLATGTFTSYPEEDTYSFGLPSGQWLGVGWDDYPVFPAVRSIYLKHDMGGWITTYHGLKFDVEKIRGYPYGYTNTNERLYVTDLTNRWDSTINMSVFSAQCDHISTNIIFEIYNSSYATIADSFNAGFLNYTMSYQMNMSTTGLNAWSVVGSLLTFQAPNVGWTGTGGLIMNSIIAFPVWAMIAYLLYKLITGLIPFMSGGSGD